MSILLQALCGILGAFIGGYVVGRIVGYKMNKLFEEYRNKQ